MCGLCDVLEGLEPPSEPVQDGRYTEEQIRMFVEVFGGSLVGRFDDTTGDAVTIAAIPGGVRPYVLLFTDSAMIKQQIMNTLSTENIDQLIGLLEDARTRIEAPTEEGLG